MCYGLAREDIAVVLNITAGTVGAHRDMMYKHLNLPVAKALVPRAITNGFSLDGHFNGHYLFSNHPKAPWLNGGKVPIPKSNQGHEPPTP